MFRLKLCYFAKYQNSKIKHPVIQEHKSKAIFKDTCHHHHGQKTCLVVKYISRKLTSIFFVLQRVLQVMCKYKQMVKRNRLHYVSSIEFVCTLFVAVVNIEMLPSHIGVWFEA